MAKVDPLDGDSASPPAPPIQGPVEARSLSSITSIASNPPAYPRNPTQKKLEPLVLYIVRVPGSKDVFLSPLKPPTKSSVSAEAINASLYYLHAATPEDEILLQECEQEREELARMRKEGLLALDPDMPLSASEYARLNNVRRKPVPGATNQPHPPPLPTRPRSTTLPQPQLENTYPSQLAHATAPPPLPPRPTFSETSSPAEAMARLTGMDGESFINYTPAGQEDRPPLPRRPPPPVPRREGVFHDYAPPKRDHRWSALSGYTSHHVQSGREIYEAATSTRHSLDIPRPQARPHSSLGVPARSPARSPRQTPNPQPPDNTAPYQPGFHITLIRRDPAHGTQWNVATISTPQIDGSGIDIEVSTPGYSRFATKNEPVSLESLGMNLPAEARNLLSRHAGASQSDPLATPADSSSGSCDPSQPRRFHRKLAVSRSLTQDDPRGSFDNSGHRSSLDSLSSSPVKVANTAGFSKLKSGYYTFTSPWNGICTFSTSVNGRSLKCKHMIPSPGFPNSSSYPANENNPAVTVAEIRFNTPFQPGHLHHQHHPNSSHVSPFSLSQTPLFKDRDTPPNSTDPSISNNYTSIPSPSTTSKRATLVNIFNQSLATRHHRSHSNSSTSSGSENPNPPQPPLRRPPSDERLDLSLAREPAGGGMRGKSAKLGKLIIEDEGIKMLDLVVAACMAVWWRGYYY